MSQPAEIIPLERRSRDIRRFLKVPYAIYNGDPNWVAPLLMDVAKVFGASNPLFEHAEIPKHEGVRTARHKYARLFEQEPLHEELYDLEADPLETRNLAADPAHRELLERLRRRCDELRDAAGGPYVPHPQR